MTLYSKLTILFLVFCLHQSCFTFSSYGSDDTEKSNEISVEISFFLDEYPWYDRYRSSRLVHDIQERRFAERRYEAISREFTRKILNEEYDKGAAYCERLLKDNSRALGNSLKDQAEQPNEKRAVYWGVGDFLGELSEMLECVGKYREAQNIEGVFIGGTNDAPSKHWQAARYAYSQGRYDEAFKFVYEALAKNYAFWNLDAAILRGRTFPYTLDFRERRLSGIEYDEVYGIIDECVRVVCPSFHWKYKNSWPTGSRPDRVNELEQYRKSFQEFMRFIEDEYSRQVSRDEPNNDNERCEELYRPMVEQFRKLEKVIPN